MTLLRPVSFLRFVCVCVCVCVCVYVCVRACVRVCRSIYTCVHTHSHIPRHAILRREMQRSVPKRIDIKHLRAGREQSLHTLGGAMDTREHEWRCAVGVHKGGALNIHVSARFDERCDHLANQQFFVSERISNDPTRKHTHDRKHTHSNTLSFSLSLTQTDSREHAYSHNAHTQTPNIYIYIHALRRALRPRSR